MPYAGIPAPDGNNYFGVLPPPAGLIQGYETVVEAIKLYKTAARESRDPRVRAANRSRADILEAGLLNLNDSMTALGTQTAVRATEGIKKEIARTSVRPRTDKNTHLDERILSRPIPTVLPSAAVGVADISELDQAADTKGRPYWLAQNYGSDHLVGRVFYGFYEPSHTAPSQVRNRLDAQFEPGQGQGMVIQNRIEARHFLEVGFAEAAAFRFREFGTIKGRLFGALNRALGPAVPTTGGVSRSSRRTPGGFTIQQTTPRGPGPRRP